MIERINWICFLKTLNITNANIAIKSFVCWWRILYRRDEWRVSRNRRSKNPICRFTKFDQLWLEKREGYTIDIVANILKIYTVLRWCIRIGEKNTLNTIMKLFWRNRRSNDFWSICFIDWTLQIPELMKGCRISSIHLRQRWRKILIRKRIIMFLILRWIILTEDWL